MSHPFERLTADEDGEAWLEEACTKGWEGPIAKRAAAAYQHGRSRK